LPVAVRALSLAAKADIFLAGLGLRPVGGDGGGGGRLDDKDPDMGEPVSVMWLRTKQKSQSMHFGICHYALLPV